MVMTRVWPIMMVQVPTVVVMVSNFNNEFRQIFLDGRQFSDPDKVTFTYNGESIGKFEGDTLVVETRYIETWNHYIDAGIPISEDFKVRGAHPAARGRQGARDRIHHDRPQRLGR